MAEDINPERRAAINAEQDQIKQELRGLYNMVNDNWSSEMQAFLQGEIQERERRRGLNQQELDAMDTANVRYDAMLADGYPGFPPTTLPPAQQAELDAYLQDTKTGAGVFGPVTPPPPTLSIRIGAPVDA